MNDLSNYRKSYDKNELLEANLPDNPITLFQTWFQQVEQQGGTEEVNAMTVATIGVDGFPKSRVVLLKKFDNNGFIFYTNYNSEKGQSISNNPNICLSFFWHALERQVIIKGTAQKTSEKTSDDYFASRPEGSKLGAIVSDQSQVIPNRIYLQKKLADLENNISGNPILRPDNWGGFLVQPIEIEFWQGRPNRLHDRIRFQLNSNNVWTIDRLSP